MQACFEKKVYQAKLIHVLKFIFQRQSTVIVKPYITLHLTFIYLIPVFGYVHDKMTGLFFRGVFVHLSVFSLRPLCPRYIQPHRQCVR